MGIIDWLADKVQESTGEKERRALVARAKELCSLFRVRVTQAVNALNEQIRRFNDSIQKLNAVRESTVKENIDTLFLFLKKYGNCKTSQAYAAESEKIPAQFPQQEQDRIENYIQDIDWSSDEVFWNTFLRTPLGMKFKTRKQNLSMREGINDLQMQLDRTLQQLETKRQDTELEQRICSRYTACVNFISDFIKEKILPELDLVDAFFQAQELKDLLICRQSADGMQFSYPVTVLIGTPYETHYHFIRNTFFFYILSCAFYDTPVLTNLLAHNATEEDLRQITEERAMIDRCAGMIDEHCLLNNGKQV